jgi:integrase/recombinase XerD
MELCLYRRHESTCSQKRLRQDRTYESDERKRGFKRCDCLIQAEGKLDVFSRKSTGERSWERAKAVAAVWESAGTWKIQARRAIWETQSESTANVGLEQSAAPRDLTQIADARVAFVDDARSRNLTEATVRKHLTMLKQLGCFAAARGYVAVQQFTPQDIAAFRATWTDCPRASANKLQRVKGFFRFCVDNEWIEENPAEKVRAPIGAGRAANKTPFSDAELNRIYDACERLPTQKWSNGRASGAWDGQVVKTFVMLAIHTGLRISDLATFSIEHLDGNNVFLFMHKTGKPLYTWIPDELVDRLRALPPVQGGHLFLGPFSARKETAADLWRRKLNKVFELCGKWDERPHPHRFRHTFARMLLQRGVKTADVAELLGDTEEMVRLHYAKWVPERQERLTQILKAVYTASAH